MRCETNRPSGPIGPDGLFFSRNTCSFLTNWNRSPYDVSYLECTGNFQYTPNKTCTASDLQRSLETTWTVEYDHEIWNLESEVSLQVGIVEDSFNTTSEKSGTFCGSTSRQTAQERQEDRRFVLHKEEWQWRVMETALRAYGSHISSDYSWVC